MNKKKILMLTILAIFIVGIAMGSTSATHTIKAGKFKAKISNSEYNKNMLIKKVTGNSSKAIKTKYLPYHPAYNKKAVKRTRIVMYVNRQGYWNEWYVNIRPAMINPFCKYDRAYKKLSSFVKLKLNYTINIL